MSLTLYTGVRMSTWQLEVLGKARFCSGARTLTPERKMAALLTYLALEGPTPRSKLAGLFWPDAPERTARNNLSQLVVRIKKMTGAALLAGSDPLQVTKALEVDAANLKVATLTDEHHAIIQSFGLLLAPYDYDDLPEFDEWLLAERERLGRLYEEALGAEIARLEEGGAYREAVLHAERLLAANPASEETHRHLMRLHYLAGDRPAAFGTYARLKEVLRREFGVEPLPETVALAREIEKDAVVPAGKPRRPVSRIPLQVLRPPLVGREREWALLEEAWERGQAVFLSGPPGVGKTRLALDFAASKGSYQLFEARPGDADVPFAYQTRVWRQCLATHPEVTLEPWVRRELSRLLPELAETPPPPLRSEEDRLRLFEAMAALMWLATGPGIATVVVNDLHYADAASAEASRYLAQQYVPSEGVEVTPTITTFRTGELSEAQLEGIEALQTQGYALHLELSPLAHPDIASLVEGLKLPEVTPETAPRLTDYLHRTTGGNPLFVVETLKSLLERECLAAPPPSPPASSRVTGLFKERLARLSMGAKRLAWTAAVAGSDFGSELAEHVLDTNPFDLAEPWGELEAAGVLEGSRFTHDLLAETALKSVPTPVKTLLHRRCADFMEARRGNPARVAQHLLGVGDEEKAVPFLLEAAESAKATFHLAEAAGFYERAAAVLERHGQFDSAFDTLINLSEMLIGFDNGPRHEAVIAKLVHLAGRASQKANAHHSKAYFLNRVGRAEESEAAARAGHEWALIAGDRTLQARLLNDLAAALWAQDRVADAADVFQSSITIYEELDDVGKLSYSLLNKGVALHFLERRDEAISCFCRAEELAVQLGEKSLRGITLVQIGNSLHEKGLTRKALNVLLDAHTLYSDMTGDTIHQLCALLDVCDCWRGLADYAKAHECMTQALDLVSSNNLPKGWLPAYQAKFLSLVGEFAKGEAELEVALKEETRILKRGIMWLIRAQSLIQQERACDEALSQAEECFKSSGRKLNLGELWVAKAVTLPPADGLILAQQALEVAQSQELGGLEIAARTRCAQLLLALQSFEEARQHTTIAKQRLDTYTPTDFYLGEVLFTHYRVLEALHDPSAGEQLKRCLEWVMNVADTKTPPEYRQSFLERNPTNRAVLGAARAHGLL